MRLDVLPEERGRRDRFGARREANNATDCDLENYLRAFWDFRHTRKRKQRFENSIGKAYENEPRVQRNGQRLTSIDRKPTVKEATMTLPNKTEHRAIVDTHRHPWGKKMQAKIEERGLLDPKQGFPQTNALDLMAYREVFDLDYAMPIQREGGITSAS
jgi:hypothetical protein